MKLIPLGNLNSTDVVMQLLKNLFQRHKPDAHLVAIPSRFQLISPMGQGTMSKVWKADDRERQQIVALKIIDREQQEKINAKFPQVHRPSEGEVAVGLDHPHIVKTYEHGESTAHEPFLVMEYIDGHSLLETLEKHRKLIPKFGFRWMLQMGEGLAYYHAQNYIHRDFCPKNILVTTQGQIKLIDFGLTVPNTAIFQAPGNRTGTADYMAPELVKRQRTDQRIDVYAYAVSCYQLLAGKLPYPSGKSLEMIVKNLNRPPKELLEVAPDMPPELTRIIMKGMEKRPEDRWQSVTEMVAAFRSLKT